MTPNVSDLILDSLEYTDKCIEVADENHVTTKQKWQVQIKICNNNRYLFIAIFYNILLSPYLCDMLFSIITLMNLEHTSLFHKGFCTVYFGNKD